MQTNLNLKLHNSTAISDHQNDPASEFHLAGRLRWRPDDNLVQIKWLYKNDWESLQQSGQNRYESASEQNRYESAQSCYAEETESEEEDSSSADECGSLAVHLSRSVRFSGILRQRWVKVCWYLAKNELQYPHHYNPGFVYFSSHFPLRFTL